MGEFINPGMAWFALAGLIPIIIHLLNRRKYKRINWAAMEFLLEALKKTKKRIQLENLILLIIRVMLLVLLALALARCYFQKSPLAALATTDTHMIIILDNSYSMEYRSASTSLFEEARNIALKIVDKANPSQGDKISLITLSSNPAIAINEAGANLNVVKKAIENLSISDYGTSCYDTLLLCQDVINKSKSSRKIVYLLTDCQKISWIVKEDLRTKFNDLLTKLSDTAEVKIIDLGKENPGNNNINSLKSSKRIIQTDKTANFEVEINNFSQSDLPNLEVSFYVDEFKISTSSVQVGPLNTTIAHFSYDFRDAGPHKVKAVLEQDNLTIDNERYLSVDVRDTIKVLLVNGEPSPDLYENETTYLKYALQPSKSELDRFSIYTIDTVSELIFEDTDLSKYDIVILANLEAMSQEKVKALEEYAKNGGGILIFLGDKINRAFYNEHLFKNGLGLIPGDLVDILGDKEHQNYVKLDKFDFDHELMNYFKSNKELLSKIFVFEYYKIKTAAPNKTEPNANDTRILARFNDADENPALMEKSFGKGKVIVVTTSADIEWNTMPVVPAGVILYDLISQYLAIPDTGMKNILVRNQFNMFIKGSDYSPTFSLIIPDRGIKYITPRPLEGLPTPGLRQAGDKGFILTCPETDTDTVGFYSLEKTNAEAHEKLFTYFSVNLDPREGNLKKISETELKQMYNGFKFETMKDLSNNQSKTTRTPPSSNLWKYLIWTIFGLVILETILAQRFNVIRK
jgi:uncharacterized membrane protein